MHELHAKMTVQRCVCGRHVLYMCTHREVVQVEMHVGQREEERDR